MITHTAIAATAPIRVIVITQATVITATRDIITHPIITIIIIAAVIRGVTTMEADTTIIRTITDRARIFILASAFSIEDASGSAVQKRGET